MGLSVDRQQLFGNSLGDRVEPGAGTASEDDAFTLDHGAIHGLFHGLSHGVRS